MVEFKIGLQIEVLRSFYQPLLICKPYQNESLRQCSFCVTPCFTPMKVVKYSSPEYQAFLGEKGKDGSEKGRELPNLKSKISSPLAP